MKPNLFCSSALAFLSLAFAACGNQTKTNDSLKDSSAQLVVDTSHLHEEAVSYTADGKTMNGFVVFNESVQGKRPAILVVPEWWGLNNYTKNRARQLAQLGYIAMAVDMYGNGRTADNPDEARKLAMPFYKDPNLTKTYIDAALAKIKSYPQTDSSKIAAIGYCYGGYCVLNAAKLGVDLKAVVSFHGNLSGVAPSKDSLKAQVLVCHGEADKFVTAEELANFKKQMDSVGAHYTVKTYPNATHAFTNPEATATGKKFNMLITYNEAADKASWQDMKEFLDRIFH